MTDSREIVHARKIRRVEKLTNLGFILHLDAGKNFKMFSRFVEDCWIEKHKPGPQGYYVEYEGGSDGYSATLPSDTLSLDQQVAEIARICHEVNRALCNFAGESMPGSWEDIPDWQRESVIQGVNKLLTTPKATPEDLHVHWCAHKESRGWKYAEAKDAEAKTHPCLISWHALPLDQKVKNYTFAAIVRAMQKGSYDEK